MESAFDFDKVYSDIVCDKEVEITNLKNIVLKLEKYVSRQQKLKDAKDLFISTLVNIVSLNNDMPDHGEYKMLSRMGAFSKVQGLINFIDSLNTPCMIDDAWLLKREISQLAFYHIDDCKKRNYLLVPSIIKSQQIGMKSFGPSNFYTSLYELFDTTGPYQQLAIKAGRNDYNAIECLEKILYAIVAYLDAIIED